MPSIRIDFRSFWMSGSGEGIGLAVDEETVLDANGLPFLPGRHVKGVLREAARRLVGVRPGLSATEIDWLFGTGGRHTGFEGTPGLSLLSVRDARLSPGLTAELRRDKDVRANLYRDLASTAIDEFGVATTASLRTIRVVVPMILSAPIAFARDRCGGDEIGRRLAAEWTSIVADALVLTTSFGAGRNKGLGSAFARLVS